MIEKLPELINEDEAVVHRGRFLNAQIRIVVGSEEWFLTIQAGRIVAAERGPFLMRPCAITIRATVDAWNKFWQQYPQPGYQDIFGMTKRGEAEVDGDWVLFMQNLRYFKDILQAPRKLNGGKQ